MGGALLQNELKRRLPASIKTVVLGVDNIAYAVVPVIRTLPQPLKDTVREAFAAALVPIWRMLIGVAAVGLLVSLPMKSFPLHTMKDESWGMQDASKRDE